jgi:hypothetical protein
MATIRDRIRKEKEDFLKRDITMEYIPDSIAKTRVISERNMKIFERSICKTKVKA